MPVTLDLPPHILETARKYAALEGVSLDVLVARAVELLSKAPPFLEQESEKKSPFGLFLGSVTYMADDFNAPLDDFKEYME
jgi:hypothetical protein